MWDLFIWMLVFLVSGIAFYTDHTRMIIPNWLSACGSIAGLLVHTVAFGLHGLAQSLIGLSIAMFCMLILYSCKGVGAGDVKLFAAYGAIGGWEISLYGLIYSLVAAAIGGLLLIGWKVIKAKSFRGMIGRRLQFPFMYAVLPGFLLTYWLLEVQV